MFNDLHKVSNNSYFFSDVWLILFEKIMKKTDIAL